MVRSAKVVAFSTTSEMSEEIDRAASEAGLSRSALIRAAVERYLAARPGNTDVARETRAGYVPHERHASAPPLYGLHRVLLSRRALSEACRTHGVRRLWLYGSAVRDDFVPGSSDYDFQADFEPDFDVGPWAKHLFELREELEAILGAKVDIGQAVPIHNPHLRAAIEEERVLVYDST